MQQATQLTLFGKKIPKTISIKDSALDIGVSSATVRNLIKTGYLVTSEKGAITIDSLKEFKKEIAGKEKLNKRANKSLKDSHDHKKIVSTYLKKIAEYTNGYDVLGDEYQAALSDSYRNKEGIYYTPKSIVNDLFNEIILEKNNLTFCDPCCGSGNFIIRALSLGFKPENIYGFDTDPIAVELTKVRILDESGYISNNIILADFLELQKEPHLRKFDYIFTNPPWGKKIEKNEREVIGSFFNAGTSIDTCSLFLFACLESLTDNGRLGLLLPEAFYNIASYKNARKRILKYEIEKLIDFEKPFRGLMTRAQAIIATKKMNNVDNIVTCQNKKQSSQRKMSSFAKNPKSILNLYCSSEDANTIEYICSIQHITLKDNAKWGLGIVTGNNAKFIKENPGDGLIPVFKGSDIVDNELNTPSCYIPSDLSLYQQVSPIDIYKAREKIIYQFISSRLRFFYDTSQRFILNSANILIPNKMFPVKMKILCGLFNSDVMNWIFAKIFNTHKILRSDLEYLPIHAQFLQEDKFIESEFLKKLGVERSSDGTFRIKR